MSNIHKAKYILIGAIFALMVLLLMGATNYDNQIGRYQISAVNTSYAYIIDTTNGDFILQERGRTGRWVNLDRERVTPRFKSKTTNGDEAQ